MENYLMHHGIKGQKWGVRRYQNADGSLTPEGRKRQMYGNRVRNRSKTKKDMDDIFNKMSYKEKELLNARKDEKEWLSVQQGSWVAKRIIKKIGKTPVAAIDIFETGNKGELTVGVMTDPNHRGKGYASELAKKAVNWYDKNKERLGATKLTWDAHEDNKASIATAKKAGFKYKSGSGKNYSGLVYK